MSKKKPMNLREYWDTVGTANVREIILKLDSSMPYARLLKYGIKKPGHVYALRFIDAAREITPGFEPDLELMLRGAPRANSGTGKMTPPSAEFLKAQRKLGSQTMETA
jgi:hypothetical protein